jgi:hypothetical protein
VYKSHFAGGNYTQLAEKALVRVEITVMRFEVILVCVLIADLFLYLFFLYLNEVK